MTACILRIAALVNTLPGDDLPVEPRDTIVVEHGGLVRDAVHRGGGADAPFLNHEVLVLRCGLVRERGDEI